MFTPLCFQIRGKSFSSGIEFCNVALVAFQYLSLGFYEIKNMLNNMTYVHKHVYCNPSSTEKNNWTKTCCPRCQVSHLKPMLCIKKLYSLLKMGKAKHTRGSSHLCGLHGLNETEILNIIHSCSNGKIRLKDINTEYIKILRKSLPIKLVKLAGVMLCVFFISSFLVGIFDDVIEPFVVTMKRW